MNLGEFKELVEETAGRKKINVLPFIKFAKEEIERKWDFRWMGLWADFTLSKGKNAIAQPKGLKRVEFLRFYYAGKWHYTEAVAPQEEQVAEGIPQFYWIDGARQFVFDKEAFEDLSGEISGFRYTDFPKEDTGTHWLLDFGADALLAKTMMNLAGYLREDTQVVYQYWQGMYHEAVETMLNEQSRFEHGNHEMQMGYHVAGS